MSKINFDPSEEGGLELARAIVLERPRNDKNWSQYDYSGAGFDRFVEYVGDPVQGRRKLVFLAQDVLWEFMIQGVVAAGLNVNNPNLPFFHMIPPVIWSASAMRCQVLIQQLSHI